MLVSEPGYIFAASVTYLAFKYLAFNSFIYRFIPRGLVDDHFFSAWATQLWVWAGLEGSGSGSEAAPELPVEPEEP